ncbi:hypothetical protein MVEN_00439300 [Mycena venus]|uniref:Uncharacterized protein n=1 Tax=Mycena venus TaxID=2733690 RepID=A0A8H6YUU8_9AGAR|nr:hypothetical protein MVEN_00439300 [Mycena venus]
MDASSVTANVTVDDFDSIVSYADQSASSSSSFNANTSQWLTGTCHSKSAHLKYSTSSRGAGALGMTDEQMKPTFAYFAHNLSITNMAVENKSFFDLDSVVLSVPSLDAPRTLDNNMSSIASGNASTSSPGDARERSAVESPSLSGVRNDVGVATGAEGGLQRLSLLKEVPPVTNSYQANEQAM